MSNLLHERLPMLTTGSSEASESVHRSKAEQLAQREAAIKALSSGELTPDARVTRYEQMHGIRLPRGARHPVLRIIARATGLTLSEVTEVQRERAKGVAHPLPPPSPSTTSASAVAQTG